MFQYDNKFIVSAITISSIVLLINYDKLFKNRFLLLPYVIGTISYSLYLVHDILGMRIINLTFRYIEMNSNNLLMLSVFSYIGVVIFTYFFWLVSEILLTKYLNNRLKGK